MPSWEPPLSWCCCVSIRLLTPSSMPAECSQSATTSPNPVGNAAEDSAWGAPACASLTARARAQAICAWAACCACRSMLHTEAYRGMLLRWTHRLMHVPVMPAGSCPSSPVCGSPAPGRCAGQGRGRPLPGACSCGVNGGPQGTKEATAGGAGQYGIAAAGRSAGAAHGQLSERWLQGR